MKLSLDNVAEFFDFCNERHAIYLRRQRGDPWPWTNDKVLQQFKFTNIYRELDTGTKWLRENIREPYARHPELFFNIAVYRRHNRIETAKFTGFFEDYDYQFWENRMEHWRNKGNRVFTSAYMTCGGLRDTDGTVSKSKIHQFFNLSFKYLWEHRKEIEPQPGDTLEQAFNRCLASRTPGFGPFIWYEVITDLRWTRYLENATDIMTWANPGPGAARGVGRVLGYTVRWREETAKISFQDFKQQMLGYTNKKLQLSVMRKLLERSPQYLGHWMEPLELRDVEHSLCEFDKYKRAVEGTGRPKQTFVPPHLRKFSIT